MMTNTFTLNEKLTIAYPDGFRLLNEEELKQLTFIEKGPGYVIRDDERHIMISCAWKNEGLLESMFLSAHDLARKNEENVRKAMQGFGYHGAGFPVRNIAGEDTEGFCYEYTAQDIEMYAETYTIKKDKVLYYLHFYTRSALKEENLKIWEEMLSGAKWQ